MTRINVIDPERLNDKHLIAEYRELPRVFNLVRRTIEKGGKFVQIDHYILGKGHVKFFYTRLGYLKKRQESIIREMQSRGFKPSFTHVDISDIPESWKQEYEPTLEAILLNVHRINQRGGLRE